MQIFLSFVNLIKNTACPGSRQAVRKIHKRGEGRLPLEKSLPACASAYLELSVLQIAVFPHCGNSLRRTYISYDRSKSHYDFSFLFYFYKSLGR